MEAELLTGSHQGREVGRVLYAPWLPESLLGKAGRERAAAILLHRAGVFPKAGDPCLEVGFGWLGWLGTVLSWGVRERDLHGIDLDPIQVNRGREVLSLADLRVGDASNLPWESNRFRLVIASTLFTSLLDQNVRRLAADEITRVLAGGGALLWYDFTVNSPRNPAVRKVNRRELRQLFPRLTGEIRSVTLAPPLARLVAPRSWALATLMEAIPLLRTHLLAVLVKHC
jgi:ubiquinone/menaquinone biosynthesis C-methylase UbiE